jgi:hypothetical protein
MWDVIIEAREKIKLLSDSILFCGDTYLNAEGHLSLQLPLSHCTTTSSSTTFYKLLQSEHASATAMDCNGESFQGFIKGFFLCSIVCMYIAHVGYTSLPVDSD